MSNVRFSYTNRLEQPATLLLNGPAIVLGSINSCTSGVNTITRASGSYITDGIKRWSLLSGTIAARFPANSRVTAVTALSLTMSANATSTGSNEAATFTPTAPLVQDSSYPMSNLVDAQRFVPWDPGVGSFPQTIGVEFDLNTALSVALCGVLAIGWDVAQRLGISEARFYSGSTYGTWTLQATLDPNVGIQRDIGQVIGTVTHRFWRIELDFDVRCQISGLYAGPIDQDLGISIAPGFGFKRIKPATMQRTPAGSPIYSFLGDYERRRWELRWSALTTVQRSRLEGVFDNHGLGSINRRTPILIDENDQVYEVEYQDLEFSWTKVFASVDGTAFEFESLP